MKLDSYAAHLPGIVSVTDQQHRHIDRRTVAAVEANAAARRVGNKRELERRIAAMRDAFTASLGPTPYNSAAALEARVTGVIEEEDMRIEKVIFTSRPHIYVTASVYVPRDLVKPAPAVLFQPGHAANGKAHPQYQQVARTIAAHGMIVMLMDPPGQGERLNYWERGEEKPRIPGAVADHDQFGTLLYLAGRTPSAYFLSDAMRAVDYLISRPDVDPMRIGATGSSGGGTMTSVLAVMDPRIAAAAPGTFLSTRDAISVGGQLQDIEQMWPGTMAEGFDHHELIACFCPKPYMILAVDADSFPLDGTQEIYEYGRECYRLMGKPDGLRLAVDRSTHKYTLPLARAAGSFFAEVFGLPAREVSIDNVPVLEESALFATENGQVVWDLPDAWPMWREAQEMMKNTYRAGADIREGGLLRRLSVYSAPASVKNFRYYSQSADGRVSHVAWLVGKNLPIFGLLLTEKPGEKQPVTVVVLPHGLSEASRYEEDITALLEAGRTVLVVNLTGRGAARPKKYQPAATSLTMDFKAESDLTFLGDSLCAMLAREIVATCEVIAAELGDTAPEILAAREACIWARLAAVKLPLSHLRTVEELTVSSFFADPYYDHSVVYTTRIRGLAKYMK